MLVPLRCRYLDGSPRTPKAGTGASMLTSGAARSGLMFHSPGIGPRELNHAIWSSLSVAATLIGFWATPGEPTVE